MLNSKIESMRETRKLDFTNISFSIKKIKTNNRIINIIITSIQYFIEESRPAIGGKTLFLNKLS